MSLRIEHATPDHAALVADNLRPEDAREWDVLTSRFPGLEKSPLAGMLWGLEHGEAWYAYGACGVPVGIFGCARHRGYGAPWLMSTPAIARYGLSAVRIGRRMLARWRREFPVLMNAAHTGNTGALAYIQRLGFIECGTQHGCVVFGIRGVDHV